MKRSPFLDSVAARELDPVMLEVRTRFIADFPIRCDLAASLVDGMADAATRKDWKQREQMRQAPPPRGRIPGDLSRRERMDRKLLTRRGRRLCKQRGQVIEPVFGQTKSCRGIDRFMQRGLANCRAEWEVICGTHNLLRLWAVP